MPENVTIQRSFGKFWGLAGLRLGFALGQPALLAALAREAGPWAVNGPALAIGAQAMADEAWADDAIVYHSEATLRLDRLAIQRGWQVAGGTHLFRLYQTGDAEAAQNALARTHIWTRRFPYSTG
ncbi:aminotransferase class I/II-fold pyridoxal phosphate-dependent enzyme, partial [Glutamicibacter soli]